MQNIYYNFYKSFYLQTGGFVPAKPLQQHMYPGDFFQIINGEIVVFGNVFQKGIVQLNDAEIESGIPLNPAFWNFSNGTNKTYSGRGTGSALIDKEFEYSRQIIGFNERGSFFFIGTEPESVRIKNWDFLQQALIVKLTQVCYSFRELYIVTESATTSNWTLAIAGNKKAELEIATNHENFSLGDLFGHESSKTIQSRDIDFYTRVTKRKPCFFKAKKLAVQHEKINTFINEFMHEAKQHLEWSKDFFAHDFSQETHYPNHLFSTCKPNILDLLQANELNPNTALQYFKWVDMNLDDIEKLCINYGSENKL